LAGCQVSAGPTQSSAPSTQAVRPGTSGIPASPDPKGKLPPVVVTRDTQGAPPPQGCSPAEVGEVIARFVDAYNRGDAADVADTLANVGTLRFSISVSPALLTTTSSEVGNFVQRRHAQHERISAMIIDVDGPDGPGVPYTHGVQFTFDRAADDLPRLSMSGKGSFNCAARVIQVWNAGPPNQLQAALCPAAPTGVDPLAVIVCARG
jgi:hypothetical protein